MKKRLLILTIISILALAAVAAAASVSLTTVDSDPNDYSIELQCTASGYQGSLAKVEFWTDTTGSWAIKTTENNPSDTASHILNSLDNGTFKWNCKFFNDTADGSGNFSAITNDSFTINVSGNAAPTFSGGPIANVQFPEDTTKSAFDLGTYFSDEESLAYSASGNSSIIVTISSGAVSFSAPANWSGSENITFTASDGTSTTDSNGVYVTLLAVNDPPYISDALNNISWNMNSNYSFTISDHFADIDTTTLGYTATNPSHITVNISGDSVRLIPESDWAGNETITFYANDTENVTASNTVTLNVKGLEVGNQPPSIDVYAPLSSTIKMEVNEERDFEITKSDPEDDVLTVKWQLDGTDISGATADKYVFKNSEAGNYTLKVAVSDGELTTSHSWSLSVRSDTTEDTSSDNTTATSAAPTTEPGSIIKEGEAVAVCGDGKKDEGENCATCEEDVKCTEGEVCSDGECVAKTNLTKAILIITGIAVVIAGIIFLLYKLNTHKQSISVHRGGIHKEDSRVDLRKVGERPVSEVSDYYHKHKEKDRHKVSTPDFKESKLEKYVKEMRGAGHTEQEIADKLKDNGWPEWQVDIAMKAIK